MVHLARWQRITGWCGIFSFLLIAIGFFVFDPELTEGLAAKAFVDRAVENDALRMQGALIVPGMLVWLWFAAGMRERLAWGLGWSPLRAIGWASAIGAVVLFVATMVAQGTLMTSGRGDLGLDDEFLRGSFFLLEGVLLGAFALLGMWMFTTGLAAVAFGGVPSWWGWPALVVGLLTVVGGSVGHELAFVGFAFWWAWTLVGGIWLAFADDPALGSAAPATPAATREQTTA